MKTGIWTAPYPYLKTRVYTDTSDFTADSSVSKGHNAKLIAFMKALEERICDAG